MDNTLSSDRIISNLKANVETLISEIQQINFNTIDISNADALEAFEKDIHAKTTKLADTISAIKLQEALESNGLSEAEKALVKSIPKKYKQMGYRTVSIQMLGGYTYHANSFLLPSKYGSQKNAG